MPRARGLRQVCDVALGKKVIDCKDTPGFIGNRLGTLWIQVATNAAEDHDLTIEESDALAGRHFGIPSTGIFKLMDLVGLDLGPYVSKSLYDNVNQGDMFREEYRESKLLEGMIAEGYTGRKGKGRLVPPEQNRRSEGQGSQRPENRRIPPC